MQRKQPPVRGLKGGHGGSRVAPHDCAVLLLNLDVPVLFVGVCNFPMLLPCACFADATPSPSFVESLLRIIHALADRARTLVCPLFGKLINVPHWSVVSPRLYYLSNTHTPRAGVRAPTGARGQLRFRGHAIHDASSSHPPLLIQSAKVPCIGLRS